MGIASALSPIWALYVGGYEHCDVSFTVEWKGVVEKGKDDSNKGSVDDNLTIYASDGSVGKSKVTN